ncbi:hypothetical protein [Candidatus Uabimicrobium amorphum]|uniref:Uncharacterized protein n=1 Tax=Uabimicrobium amorphum TaxID=2596890 RepID=A0A5S9IR18_UABAM|nr:hypothetical protein [Candidatus Uabimicrobium amorphum]BBM85105.1 hypothetical protein UABAM_03468 [Candidatus Uabimicrobium amorphum]
MGSYLISKYLIYAVLFFVAVKIFFWGRQQEKKHAPKWGWRLTILFFISPILIYFADKLLPIPDEGIRILRLITKYMDYPVIFIYENVKEHLGWWAWFAKPAIAAFFYGTIGFLIGSMIDGGQDDDDEEN